MRIFANLRGAFQQNAFFRHNTIFWSASLLVSFINYLYYPVLGRLLAPGPFGETQTIISIFTQAVIFFQVLSLVSIGVITKYQDPEIRDQVLSELSRLALIFPFIILLACLLFSTSLKSFFHFSSTTPFFILAVSLLISVPLSFANSFLQGQKQFRQLSLSNLLSSIIKLVLAVILVELGLQTAGALGGLVAAQLFALLYAASRGQGLRTFLSATLRPRKVNLRLVRPELPYAGIVLLTSLATNLLLSFDILVVKHYFSPRQAGLYTGISIISNILYYVTNPFAGVMLPTIKPALGRAVNYQTLRRALRLTLLVGGSILLVFMALPHLVVLLLLGHRYASFAVYLRGLSLALFLMSLNNLFIYYHIGLRHFLIAPVVVIDLVATIGLLVANHASMGHVVLDLVVGASILFGLLLALMPLYRRELPA